MIVFSKKILLLFILHLVFFHAYAYGTKQNDRRNLAKSDTLTHSFKSPSTKYGVNCWWWWLNGNVDKEAITKDLEAMKSRNFQGAMIFDAGGHNQRGNKDIPAGPLFGGNEWNDLFVFALEEAERLGLTIGFNIQSGWNLGGPRVTPQYSAKQLTYSELVVSPDQDSLVLKQPKSRKGFYEDVAILAFPISEDFKSASPIYDLDYKLGVHELGGSAPDTRFLLDNTMRNPRDSALAIPYKVKLKEVRNISGTLKPNGLLDWKVPEGKWVILRIGYTCTDAEVSTSSGAWQGNVLDYMSKEAFGFYWADVVDPILEAADGHVGKTLKFMETDSWECGGMNWTTNFDQEFKAYRGYSLDRYLPIIAGYVVEDMETSLSFLADFRKTIADLVANNHYAEFQKRAHKIDMGIQPESAGPHAGPMDGIKNYGFSDIVMCEFWSPSPHRPLENNRFFVKQASSAAHIYGKKIVGAESFTTIGPHWNDELWHDQKSAFDQAICAGLNRVYFHTFTSSPSSMGMPGQEYFAGTHINPQITWWDQSSAFIDYMHRIQSVVQDGEFVADVLYYYGDHIPNIFPYKRADPAGARFGYDYDVTDETIFLKLKVNKGEVVVPSGLSYKVLVLPDHKVLSLSNLMKVKSLLEEGATIISQKPDKMVSLTGGTEGKEAFESIVSAIWGDNIPLKGEKKVGNGTLAWGWTAKDYLRSKGITEDFGVDKYNENNVDYIHYTLDKKEIYFVTNTTTQRISLKPRFRVKGKQPEIWNPISGEIMEAKAFRQNNNHTTVPLTLDPYGAVFVVFNKETTIKQGEEHRNYSDFPILQSITGSWNVYFDPKYKGEGNVEFTTLLDWSEHPNKKIKYYSGPAVYKKEFKLDFIPLKQERYYLELGSVKDVGIAEINMNGKNKGIVWTKPFRVDITDAIRNGKNTLEIKVVNSWFNRVAGEELEEVIDPYTNTNIMLINDYRGNPRETIPLEKSGLLGPVRIVKE
ncbi:glycoside hydrolase [Echinicola strongylocentroti]|uniref:Glycoside hydrolase n=1 Tax=Echinicola strongylocentroti TaxID=1795355 RepID=A0A2Z4IDV7_9BACT|nr:glycosyl hydrolase [Echinicola strongylocentroti]AWW28678.1 glycoside hydrolase [Echinicola strongylocentroti]